ncbi:hypothetical protein BDK51DRAFT_32806, partial [Blyttiomyces helicus]
MTPLMMRAAAFKPPASLFANRSRFPMQRQLLRRIPDHVLPGPAIRANFVIANQLHSWSSIAAAGGSHDDFAQRPEAEYRPLSEIEVQTTAALVKTIHQRGSQLYFNRADVHKFFCEEKIDELVHIFTKLSAMPLTMQSAEVARINKRREELG